jgi:4,5-dihydroxyphthalate decarboxylase
MHIIGMRRTRAAEPGLARALYDGFLAAKNYAMAELGMMQAAKITLPWVMAAFEDSTRILGADYWSYGIFQNRGLLSSFLDGAHRDHLTPRALGLDELFHPDLLDT